MSPNPAKRVDFAETSRLIRREIGRETNAHFLRRLPVFQADHDLPDDMKELLARLDLAERTRAG